jgi:GTPase
MNSSAEQTIPAAASEFVEQLAARVVAGGRRAIAHALTLADADAPEAALLEPLLRPHTGRSHLVGVTGPPGAGKSTLVNSLIAELRRRGKRVGVLAVDPSSPISGGAVLGDRVRMAAGDTDEGVFIRSLAARGHLGGLSRSTLRAAQVLAAAAYDVVIIETVGAGQSEIAIAGLAHSVMVVLPPGLGDEVQALKAGILEIAHLLVVNKGDLPGAERAATDLRAMLRLRPPARRGVPVLRTVASSGEGVAALADALEAHAAAARVAGMPIAGGA